MKKINLLLIIIVSSFTVQSQISAITEMGDEVILYTDGSWNYIDKTISDAQDIKTNSYNFTKDRKSTFLLKSKVFNIGVYLNPKDWTIEKGGELNSETEYELNYKHGDVYSIIITEEIEIPLESLGEIALQNAKSVAEDIHIVKQEFRNINGKRVLFMQMNGTVYGIAISYYSYYFSNENGTIQLITYTTQKLLDKYMNDCEKLLNGLVEL